VNACVGHVQSVRLWRKKGARLDHGKGWRWQRRTCNGRHTSRTDYGKLRFVERFKSIVRWYYRQISIQRSL
jgi:hypothetical protein